MSEVMGSVLIGIGASTALACVLFMVWSFFDDEIMDYVTEPNTRRIETWMGTFLISLGLIALGGWMSGRDQLVSTAGIMAVCFLIPTVLRGVFR